MKWLYVFSRFELSILDRNRHAPDRLIPFPISRNTDFVFPSDFPVPVSVPDQKIQLRERLRGFPDRSRPFSSLSPGKSPRRQTLTLAPDESVGDASGSLTLGVVALRRHGKVAYLDTDVGQPEFGLPGCLSFHIVDEALEG